ncbi:MAG: hypothetical protein FJ125_02390 [Deltaproteobacteria bacterium]|nr:hypothetical protein [Deltaproteobacteria bacterium]
MSRPAIGLCRLPGTTAAAGARLPWAVCVAGLGWCGLLLTTQGCIGGAEEIGRGGGGGVDGGADRESDAGTSEVPDRGTQSSEHDLPRPDLFTDGGPSAEQDAGGGGGGGGEDDAGGGGGEADAGGGSDEECAPAGARCLTEEQGFPDGLCSLLCERLCPDSGHPGDPVTFCVELPGWPGEGSCVSRCDQQLFPGSGCRDGYSCRPRPRHGEPGIVREVCLPDGGGSDPPERCNGTSPDSVSPVDAVGVLC